MLGLWSIGPKFVHAVDVEQRPIVLPNMRKSCLLNFAMGLAFLGMASCGTPRDDSNWHAPAHPVDSLKPWRPADDTLSWIALRWIQALDRGDTLALTKVLTDRVYTGEDSAVPRSWILGPLFYKFRSGYRQQTECLALLPTLSLEDSVYRVMGYLRQRYQAGQVGSGLQWKYRRLAVQWELRSTKIAGWKVWEQDWPDPQDGEDSLSLNPWPRWGMRCSTAPDSLRTLVLEWEKRLMAHYVRDAATFWRDTASVRSHDGWVWSGPPLTMARFMAKEAAPYRDMDSVLRGLNQVEVLRLGTNGEIMGMAFGTEQCYRNQIALSRGIHRLYFFRDGQIHFAEQFRNSSIMP